MDGGDGDRRGRFYARRVASVTAMIEELEARKWLPAIYFIFSRVGCERALEDDAKGVAKEVERLRKAAQLADEMGLEVHAGHGLTYNTVAPVARMPQMIELNIGHFLIGEAIFGGLHSAIRHMRTLMDQARAEPKRPLAAQ